MFKKFLAYIENQFHTSIKFLLIDSGGEYISHEFQGYLQQKGIISQRSCPYMPQQNGVAERKNRHLLDVTRTLLLQASVPSSFWVEALSTAVYLINRLPSQVLDFESPFFCLYNIPPSYYDLHIFGCVCFVHLPPLERHKLGAHSLQCAFIGYAPNQKGFLCYDATAYGCVSLEMWFSLIINIFFKGFPLALLILSPFLNFPRFIILHNDGNQDISLSDAHMIRPLSMLSCRLILHQ